MDEVKRKLHECDVILGTMARSSAKDKLVLTQETLRRNDALMAGMIASRNVSYTIWPWRSPVSHIHQAGIKQSSQTSSQVCVSVYSLNSNLNNVRILYLYFYWVDLRVLFHIYISNPSHQYRRLYAYLRSTRVDILELKYCRLEDFTHSSQ